MKDSASSEGAAEDMAAGKGKGAAGKQEEEMRIKNSDQRKC